MCVRNKIDKHGAWAVLHEVKNCTNKCVLFKNKSEKNIKIYVIRKRKCQKTRNEIVNELFYRNFERMVVVERGKEVKNINYFNLINIP